MSPRPDNSNSAAEGETRRVVDQFLEQLSPSRTGDRKNFIELLHDDVVFTVTGQTPLSGTYRGIEDVRENFHKRAAPLMGHAPSYGLFPTGYIEEGDDLVVLAKGRGGNLKGAPYNNTYFLYFRVKEGRIIHYIEDFDSSLAWRSIFQCHLE